MVEKVIALFLPKLSSILSRIFRPGTVREVRSDHLESLSQIPNKLFQILSAYFAPISKWKQWGNIWFEFTAAPLQNILLPFRQFYILFLSQFLAGIYIFAPCVWCCTSHPEVNKRCPVVNKNNTRRDSRKKTKGQERKDSPSTRRGEVGSYLGKEYALAQRNVMS